MESLACAGAEIISYQSAFKTRSNTDNTDVIVKSSRERKKLAHSRAELFRIKWNVDRATN